MRLRCIALYQMHVSSLLISLEFYGFPFSIPHTDLERSVPAQPLSASVQSFPNLHFLPACWCHRDMIRWLSRCIPGLSTLFLIALLVFAFGDVEAPQRLPLQISQEEKCHLQSLANFDLSPHRLRFSQQIFILYTLLVHIDTALFAVRLFFSIIVVKKKIRATLLRRDDLPSGFYSEGILNHTDTQELNLRPSRRDSITVKLDQSSSAIEVIHAIVLPNYQEDIDTMRMTLAVLATHPRAATHYEVSTVNSSLRFQTLTLFSIFLGLLGYGAKGTKLR
jgi:hypothetical protein